MKINRPITIKLTLVFILVNAFIWLLLGILIAFNYHMGLPDNVTMKAVLAVLSFLIGFILIGLAYFIQKHYHNAYYLSLLIFIGAALLTIFDDFGLADLLVLILNLIPVFLLLKDRKWYLHSVAVGNTP